MTSSEIAKSVAEVMALVDDWREKEFAAAEANDPWVENDPATPLGLSERLEVEADIARKAIEVKIFTLLEAKEAQ